MNDHSGSSGLVAATCGNEPPQTLYHYTSLETLRKVYASGTLWATHSAYLNDATELEFGLRLMSEVVDKRIATESGRARLMLEWLRGRLSLDTFTRVPVFVCCFSAERNSLSQWRSYTPHGRGVNLGFDVPAISRRAKERGWFWVQCVYDGTEQRNCLDAFLTRYLGQVIGDDTPLEAGTRALGPDQSALFQCVAQIKRREFREEHEWRLVSPSTSPHSEGVQFRDGRYSLIPYIEFQFADMPPERSWIREVVIGPSPMGVICRESLLAMQRSVRPPDPVDVILLNSPLREI